MTAVTNPLEELRRAVGREAWSTEASDLASMAHDASHYLLTPKAVVTPRTLPELVAALVTANRAGQPVMFRAAGTSLSGQSGTDGVLIDARRHFSAVKVLDGGARVRCEPGAVLRRVNGVLARHGRRLGPDPASEIACTVGGVVANNSSGMTSSTTATAYRTLASMRYVLASGTTIDTAEPDADARLRQLEPGLHAGLVRIRDRVRSEPTLRRTIEHQFSMKNTMGYGLNAFLDHEEPSEILAHLMVGSEGTLGFVASVVLDTVPLLPDAATTLLVVDSIDRATDALPGLLEAGATAVELMDAAALRVARTDPAAPAMMRALDLESHTALLVEFQAQGRDALDARVGLALPVIDRLALSVPAELTRDPAARAAMWRVRKGLYAAVAGARPAGTTNLLEDVAVPPDALTATVRELGTLLGRHGYDAAVIFGHARDANLHFMITPNLEDPQQVATYEAFTEDLVDLVLGANGTLKAEHGTGRIMSAYVRRQFGEALYEVMREIKALCDPQGILNPGVVLDDDPRAHVKHLKHVPPVDGFVDRCVECGFCEPVCPSRNTTTTPRRRIVLLREMVTADPERRRELERAYDYEAVQTCAADSLCVTACPVDIDTGVFMKRFRAESNGPTAQQVGAAVARHWEPVTAGLRAGLVVADVLPSALLSGVTRGARAVLSRDLVPEVGDDLPGPGRRRSDLLAGTGQGVDRLELGNVSGDRSGDVGGDARRASVDDEGPTRVVGTGGVVSGGDADGVADVVFFPSCTGALFGPEGGGEGASAAFLELCERAGLLAVMPQDVDALCCGTPWASKGFVTGQDVMARQVFDKVWATSDGGTRPVVCDAASCTHGLVELAGHLDPARAAQWTTIRVIDAVTFVRERVLPGLAVREDERPESLVVHPTCSTVHLGATDDLTAVAAATARSVTVPASWGCCGFAGDRGMLHPELTAGATEDEAAEIASLERTAGAFDGYVSCNRTCEMGMSRATGRPYRHVLEVLEEVTRPTRD